MIDPKKFYSDKDYPDQRKRSEMWNRIEEELPEKNSFKNIMIEWRSFSYGIAAAVVFFFCGIGVYSTLSSARFGNAPEIEKINKTYQTTIAKFEKLIPKEPAGGNLSVRVDDYLSSRYERLETIDEAIGQINKDDKKDYSFYKQKRILELYKMKLEMLEEILAIEEGGI